MSSTFVLSDSQLPDTSLKKRHFENSVHVVDGEIVGLHFGKMKGFANSKMRLIKTFNLNHDGIRSFGYKGHLHLSEADYGVFWKTCVAVLQDQLESRAVSRGDYIFDCSVSERKAQKKLYGRFQEYHGLQLKTQVARIVFRNAHKEKESSHFMTLIMGHNDETDLKDYWKPELHGAKLAKLLVGNDKGETSHSEEE